MSKYVKLDDVITLLNKKWLNTTDFENLPTVELPRWHDLRKNPEDLPENDFTDVLVTDGNGNYAIGYVVKGHWVTDELIDENVVKWMELPKNEV